MKNEIEMVKVAAISLLSSYIAFVFILAEFDPTLWATESRFMMVVTASCIGGMLSTVLR